MSSTIQTLIGSVYNICSGQDGTITKTYYGVVRLATFVDGIFSAII